MPGRHFLQIPGPTNVPDRILRAMDRPVPDHRGPELPALVETQRAAPRPPSRLGAVREAMRAASHPPLLLVDGGSALGSLDVRLDEWEVAVALAGTQKGLMLPPGMANLCAGPRAIEASA